MHSAILVFVSKLCFLSNITLFQHGSMSFTSLVTAPTLRLVLKDKYMNRIQWQCVITSKKQTEHQTEGEMFVLLMCVLRGCFLSDGLELNRAACGLHTTLHNSLWIHWTHRQTESDTKTNKLELMHMKPKVEFPGSPYHVSFYSCLLHENYEIDNFQVHFTVYFVRNILYIYIWQLDIHTVWVCKRAWMQQWP